jgi:hypothetical protein
MKRMLSLLLILALVLGALGGVPRARAATVTVTATPSTVDTVTTLNITVYASASSQSYLVLTLPSFQLPSSISSGVTVNSIAATVVNINPSTGQITLWTSTPVSSYATIVFSTVAGIKTPVSAGTYAIGCNVGSDYGYGSVVITGSAASSFTVQLYPTTAGALLQYGSIVFTPAANLVVGNTITLGFPSGTTFPVTFTAGSITVGGTSVTLAYVSGTQLTLYLGAAVTAGVSTTIAINPSYGMSNTYVAGTYQLQLTTSAETVKYSNTFQIGGGSVASPTVQVSPAAPSAAALYTVFFYTSASGALTSSDTISVQFPSGTTFPSNLNTGVVQVNSGLSQYVSRSGYMVTISMPYGITVAAGGWVQVTFPASLGITNPLSVGTYTLTINTSKDTIAVQSSQYQITGTSVTGLSLTVDTRAQSAQVQVQVSFQTSAAGTLQQNSGTITVDFPSNMTIPSSISGSLVTVNGTAAYSVSVLSNNVVTVVTPVAITAYAPVTVVFASSAGIYNPSTSGQTVTISVSTSADVAPVSASYATTTSQITQPQVTLTTNGIGKPSGYTVTFQTSAGGLLSAGTGRIYLVFPAGTTVPTTIAGQYVRVNGSTASSVSASSTNRRVEITTPVAVPASSQVTVIIDAAANIVNPLTPATSYTLAAYTSAEQTSVNSALYSIVNLPTSTEVTTPAAPDGLNGYYRTRPTVSITASSPSGYPVSIYYRINTGADTLYSGPVQIPDGTVTFTYYAKDSQNNQEQPKQLTFKVDATAPVVTIVSPQEGAVTSTAAFSISGRTEAGALVSINGTSVTVQPTGEFGGSVTLSEGANAIQVVATDVAGNVGQTRVNVTLDTKPPVLTMTSPKIYSTVMTQQVAVSGKTEAGATVTVAGAKVNVAADGSFSIMYMFPKEGLNVVDVTSTDAAGNSARADIPVTYVARTLIRLQVGNKTAMINDTTKTLQAAPINVKGVVMVPLRFIGEAFGATVEWEPVFKIVRLQLGSTAIYLQMGYNYASVNGKKIVLQGLPSIIKGTTMVPIRFISEAFNAQVTWIAATQSVEITYPKP